MSYSLALFTNENNQESQSQSKSLSIYHCILDLDGYEKLQKAGQGSQGTVYKAIERQTNQIVALKEILTGDDKKVPAETIREIAILNQLSHKNIISLKEVAYFEYKIVLILEWIEITLYSYINTLNVKEIPINPKLIKQYMQQLLNGLSYCHSKNIIHRDLKTQNLLIDREGNLKIADFGSAIEFDSNQQSKLNTFICTLWYRAPEILLEDVYYSTSSDMWSAACIFIEMNMKGAHLFPGGNELNQIEIIFKLFGTPNDTNWPGWNDLPFIKKIKQIPNYPSSSIKDFLYSKKIIIDSLALDLLNKMFIYDPKKRITAEEALKHPYFSP